VQVASHNRVGAHPLQRWSEEVDMSIAPAVAPTDGSWVSDWTGLGRCAGTDPDALFVQGKAQRAAKAVCKGCPVVAECLADALDNRTEFGVWGGMTERERRALLRRRPDVRSWTELLTHAKVGTAQGAIA
jgi:WhiB family redox-sensing transcriptional regulator